MSGVRISSSPKREKLLATGLSPTFCERFDGWQEGRLHQTYSALSTEEARRLVAAAGADHFEALWIVLIACRTPRRGARTTLVRRRPQNQKAHDPALALASRWPHDKDTKTVSSRRELKFGALALGAFERRRQVAEKEPHRSNFIFCTSVGTVILRENLRRSHFKPLIERAKVDSTIRELRPVRSRSAWPPAFRSRRCPIVRDMPTAVPRSIDTRAFLRVRTRRPPRPSMPRSRRRRSAKRRRLPRNQNRDRPRRNPKQNRSVFSPQNGERAVDGKRDALEAERV